MKKLKIIQASVVFCLGFGLFISTNLFAKDQSSQQILLPSIQKEIERIDKFMQAILTLSRVKPSQKNELGFINLGEQCLTSASGGIYFDEKRTNFDTIHLAISPYENRLNALWSLIVDSNQRNEALPNMTCNESFLHGFPNENTRNKIDAKYNAVAERQINNTLDVIKKSFSDNGKQYKFQIHNNVYTKKAILKDTRSNRYVYHALDEYKLLHTLSYFEILLQTLEYIKEDLKFLGELEISNYMVFTTSLIRDNDLSLLQYRGEYAPQKERTLVCSAGASKESILDFKNLVFDMTSKSTAQERQKNRNDKRASLNFTPNNINKKIEIKNYTDINDLYLSLIKSEKRSKICELFILNLEQVSTLSESMFNESLKITWLDYLDGEFIYDQKHLNVATGKIYNGKNSTQIIKDFQNFTELEITPSNALGIETLKTIFKDQNIEFDNLNVTNYLSLYKFFYDYEDYYFQKCYYSFQKCANKIEELISISKNFQDINVDIFDEAVLIQLSLLQKSTQSTIDRTLFASDFIAAYNNDLSFGDNVLAHQYFSFRVVEENKILAEAEEQRLWGEYFKEREEYLEEDNIERRGVGMLERHAACLKDAERFPCNLKKCPQKLMIAQCNAKFNPELRQFEKDLRDSANN